MVLILYIKGLLSKGWRAGLTDARVWRDWSRKQQCFCTRLFRHWQECVVLISSSDASLSIRSQDQTFTVESIEVSSLYNNTLQLEIRGSRDKNELFCQIIQLAYDLRTILLNCTNINRLQFRSYSCSDLIAISQINLA